MNRALLVLAFLGAVLVNFAMSLFVPETPTGQTVVFLAFGAAMYPLARVLWFASSPAWRYWVGLGLASMVGWTLDTWRRTALSESSNRIAGVSVVGLLTAALIVGVWRTRRRKMRHSTS
ncbi:MAG TPA: hypothetical protein VNJ02_05775 [Vicinamibacterales bacterium]|nr:hypothetical protein [Vicinamibacterales bacterium]